VSLVRDLLAGLGNEHWDLARMMGAGSFVSYTGAFVYALATGHIPDWSSLGVGYAAVLGGSGALIAAKDIAGKPPTGGAS
jgi:hypothetical protein